MATWSEFRRAEPELAATGERCLPSSGPDSGSSPPSAPMAVPGCTRSARWSPTASCGRSSCGPRPSARTSAATAGTRLDSFPPEEVDDEFVATGRAVVVDAAPGDERWQQLTAATTASVGVHDEVLFRLDAALRHVVHLRGARRVPARPRVVAGVSEPARRRRAPPGRCPRAHRLRWPSWAPRRRGSRRWPWPWPASAATSSWCRSTRCRCTGAWTSAPPSRPPPSRPRSRHHVIDLVDPWEDFDVHAFQRRSGRRSPTSRAGATGRCSSAGPACTCRR